MTKKRKASKKKKVVKVKYKGRKPSNKDKASKVRKLIRLAKKR